MAPNRGTEEGFVRSKSRNDAPVNPGQPEDVPSGCEGHEGKTEQGQGGADEVKESASAEEQTERALVGQKTGLDLKCKSWTGCAK